MSAPTLQEVADEIAGMLDVELAPWEALDASQAKGVKTAHVQLGVSRRFGEQQRGGRDSRSAWRVTTKYVADNVFNARELHQNSETALNGKRVTVTGQISTPIRRESDEPISEDRDSKTYTGLTVWTFVL